MKQKLLPYVKKIGIVFAIIYALFVILFSLTFQLYIKPNLNNYKTMIEELASKAIGQTIKIDSLDGRWDLINPEIALNKVVFQDDQNNTSLELKEISANFSWLSPFYLKPTLSEIKLQAPKLLIKRDTNNKIFIGGMLIDGTRNNKLTNWLLNQKKVSIEQGEIDWHDEYRQAPALSLKNLNFSYKTPFNIELIGKHKFDLNFRINNSDNQFIDLNGKIYAKKIEDIKSWVSEIRIKAGNINLAAYTPWINYPVKINAGTGDLNLNAKITNTTITKIKASLKLTSLKTELNQAYKNELNLKNFYGEIIWLRNNESQQITFENLYLLTNNGINIENADTSITISNETNKPTAFSLKINKIQLDAANEILQIIPYFDDIKSKINTIQPSGSVSNVDLKWSSNKKFGLSLNAQFEKLSLKAFENLPGFDNLTGTVNLSGENGQLNLKSNDASLTYAKFFRGPLLFNNLYGDLKWTHNNLILKNISFNNASINGLINGSIKNISQAPYLDIDASIPFLDFKHANAYYPKTMKAESLHWLDTSLLEGSFENTLISIKGLAADFPFVNSNGKPDGSKGSFIVTSLGKNTLIEYGTGWPVVEKFDFTASINGGSFELLSQKGQFLGNAIKEFKVTIPTIAIEHPLLNIKGILNSPTEEAIKFINKSPVKKSVQNLFDNASGSGEGKLKVDIDIPMGNLDAITFKGDYQFIDSKLSNPTIGIPTMEKIKGSVNFDEKNVKTENLNGIIFGGKTNITLSSDPTKIIKVKLNGRFTDKGIEEKLGTHFAKLNGSAEWEGLIEYKKPLLNIQISSDLKGIEMTYPEPFAKARDKEEKFYFSKKQNNPKSDDIVFKYSNIVNSKISRIEKNNIMAIDNGYISINSDIKTNIQHGVYLKADLPYANLNDFMAIYNEKDSNNNLKIDRADITIKNADLFDRRFNNMRIEIKPFNTNIKFKLISNEAMGNLLWSERDNKLTARFNILKLPNETKKISPSPQNENNQKIPNLDIKIDSLEIDSKKFGKVEFISSTSMQDINIQKFKVMNDKNIFQADGEWLSWNKNSRTNINFNWKINNLGEELNFLGYQNFVKDGEADISGQFKWQGSPLEFDKTKADGSFNIDVHKGTIQKIEPGLGRLFGLVTLQSLPRRLSLDFRDLFGNGFVLDSMNASVRLNNGILKTSNFRMNGPAAEVVISGETNIIKETQDLNVKVTPHISDSISIAALAGGPIVGAAAFIAQKILKDPMNKILTSEYRIIGTWDNPEELDNSPTDKIKTTIDNTKNLFTDKK